MKAKVIRLDPEQFDPILLDEPAHIVKNGGLVIFPTETVYGIAVDLNNKNALARLSQVKKRPFDKPITVHIGDRDELRKYVDRIPSVARRLIKRFWPGPLTIIFPTKGGQTIGIRYPSHKVACELIRKAGVEVGAPSANISSEPPCKDAQEAIKIFSDNVDIIIDAGKTKFGASSTVVSITGDYLKILREGVIPSSLLENFDYRLVLFVCTGNTCRSPMASAIFKSMLAKKHNINDHQVEEKLKIKIISAGTNAGVGLSMAHNARNVLKEMGLEPEEHKSQPLTISLIDEADLIFAMTSEHLKFIEELSLEARKKARLLDPHGNDIEDPIFGDINVYRNCANKIRVGLSKLMKEF
jgi:protein-tyrosine phosphatase